MSENKQIEVTAGTPSPERPCSAMIEVCPVCGEHTVQANIGDGSIDVYCEECGWPDEDFDEPNKAPRAPTKEAYLEAAGSAGF